MAEHAEEHGYTNEQVLSALFFLSGYFLSTLSDKKQKQILSHIELIAATVKRDDS